MSSNIEDDNMQHYVNIKFHSEDARPALPTRPDRRSEVMVSPSLGNEYEKIKEREEDLERIHRRSRELIRGQYEEGEEERQTINTFRPARHVFIKNKRCQSKIVIIFNAR